MPLELIQPETCSLFPPEESTGPVTVLVVDDCSFDRHVVGRLLDKMEGVRVAFAANGREGLQAVERESPAVLFTDLVMPDMEGLALVEQVRERHPEIPVVLMTAYGNEETAVRALRAGATNYIPKKDLARDLRPTLRRILELTASSRERRRILERAVGRESAFEIENDPSLIMPLLKHIQEDLAELELCDSIGFLQVGVALQEALTNAMFHGNLEVSSDLRQQDERLYDDLVKARSEIEPYASRQLRVKVQIDRNAACFVVSDEGPGFDVSLFNRPVDPLDLNRIGGRGLLLIRTFMDQVSFNERGNQITMIKRRKSAA